MYEGIGLWEDKSWEDKSWEDKSWEDKSWEDKSWEDITVDVRKENLMSGMKT
jgi:hypothetical protein